MTLWMKLDNAAKIYPLVESDFLTTVFRFSATLEEEIDPEILLKALNNIMKRFPYYQVSIKKGLFWYYLEENHKELVISKDTKQPCRRMINDTNDYLFRVLYIDNKISVEFNHILADGTACLIFLNTLVAEYLKLQGHEIEYNEWVKDINSDIDIKEFEDSHSLMGKKYYKTHNKKVADIKNVFHIKDLIKRSEYLVTYGIIDARDLSELAKKYNVSITVLLVTIYLIVILEIQCEQVKKQKNRKPVSIQVPINMRKRLNSMSMRNFSLFITPYLMPDCELAFEDIIDLVNKYFIEKTDIDNLISLIVQNYKTEKSIIVRVLPLFLKKLVTPLIYKAVGADTYSGTFSNIGLIKLPESLEKHIKRIDFLLGPCPITKTLCSVAGYKDKIYISFGRNIKDAKIERKFFRKLVQLGLKVEVEIHGGEKR